jgi:hypothetical protein
MSREIKFNCIITGNNKEKIAEFTEWLDGDGWKHDYYAPLVTNGVFHHEELGDGWMGEIIRRQFTGLYDKNKTPIYEGDLMDYGNGIAKEVSFLNGSFGVLNISPEGTSFGSYKIDYGLVVGNKYEHPNLLV